MTILMFLMGLDDYCVISEMFIPAHMSVENRQLRKSVTRRQQKKFINKNIVPLPVLKILWNMGFLPGKQPPQKGMCIKVLLVFLKIGKYRDGKNRVLGALLRDMIEREEFPEPEFGDEKFVKSGGKFIPVSHLRTIPGTIFK